MVLHRYVMFMQRYSWLFHLTQKFCFFQKCFGVSDPALLSLNFVFFFASSIIERLYFQTHYCSGETNWLLYPTQKTDKETEAVFPVERAELENICFVSLRTTIKPWCYSKFNIRHQSLLQMHFSLCVIIRYTLLKYLACAFSLGYFCTWTANVLAKCSSE